MEYEIFDLAHIQGVQWLQSKNLVPGPVWLQVKKQLFFVFLTSKRVSAEFLDPFLLRQALCSTSSRMQRRHLE